MAVVVGTNAGFVTTAPTGDPAASGRNTDTKATAFKDTSPTGDNVVTEIGWYTGTATEETNFEVGIYDHDAGNDIPLNLLSGESRTNAKGTTAGWKRVTGLSIPITAETIYWLAIQVDDTATTTQVDRTFTSGKKTVERASMTTLLDPWGVEGTINTFVFAIYAVVEEAVTGFTRKIKISGTFQDKPIKEKKAGTFEDKPIKIKVGGTFQDA